MTPVEQAAAVYQKEPCARSFREDLEAHLLNGYVFSTPTAFVMARPIDSTAPPHLAANPWHSFEKPDAWLIYLGAGDLPSLFRLFPFELPLIGWEKKNRLRFYGFQSALAKLEKMRNSLLHGHRP